MDIVLAIRRIALLYIANQDIPISPECDSFVITSKPSTLSDVVVSFCRLLIINYTCTVKFQILIHRHADFLLNTNQLLHQPEDVWYFLLPGLLQYLPKEVIAVIGLQNVLKQVNLSFKIGV